MDDLISRQAAIDALSLGKEILSRVSNDTDVVGIDREKYSWGLGLIESSINDIEQLPSAQQWIPCSERLPEVGRSVLLSIGGMYAAEGCLREDGDWTQFRWSAIQRKDMVGAWMPLPEPYEERRER